MLNCFEICIEQALKAYECGEVPIGAVVLCNDKIISKAYNLREKLKDITAHAEILAIKKASKKLNRWNLSDCTLYVTLKPCGMCETIIKQSRIKKVFYLYDKLDYKKEYDKTTFSLQYDSDLSLKYGLILTDFFKNKRKK